MVDGPDGRLGIDTGFIVHNERTYPDLLRLFDELGVATQDSEMSMSVRVRRHRPGVGRRARLAGLFPTWRNVCDPAYLRMLVEIPRFHRWRAGAARRARTTAATADADAREFLRRGRFSPYFRPHFMESLVACVWSCDPAVALEYPARYLFAFLQHHGMLAVFGSPQWRTVTGGSREYVAPRGRRAPRRAHRHQGDLGRSRPPPASRSPTATARS